MRSTHPHTHTHTAFGTQASTAVADLAPWVGADLSDSMAGSGKKAMKAMRAQKKAMKVVMKAKAAKMDKKAAAAKAMNEADAPQWNATPQAKSWFANFVDKGAPLPESIDHFVDLLLPMLEGLRVKMGCDDLLLNVWADCGGTCAEIFAGNRLAMVIQAKNWPKVDVQAVPVLRHC